MAQTQFARKSQPVTGMRDLNNVAKRAYVQPL
jgi:hypothetical protein